MTNRRTAKPPASAPGVAATATLPASTAASVSQTPSTPQAPAPTSAEKIFEQAKRRARKRLNE